MVTNAFFSGRLVPDDVLGSSTVSGLPVEVVSRRTQPAALDVSPISGDDHPLVPAMSAVVPLSGWSLPISGSSEVRRG
jgi:hypothetical protein